MAAVEEDAAALSETQEEGVFHTLLDEAMSSPINIVLLTICVILLYKIYRASREEPPVPAESKEKPIPPLPRQDMFLQQLRQYNGTDEHMRVCVAVNGKVFDMTRGKAFYGPGGPYAAFAGHDATHALASFNMDDIANESSDLSDLTPAQMESVKEWEMQFNEKYVYIGRLLKYGELPSEYYEDDDAKTATPQPSPVSKEGQQEPEEEPKEENKENKVIKVNKEDMKGKEDMENKVMEDKEDKKDV